MTHEYRPLDKGFNDYYANVVAVQAELANTCFNNFDEFFEKFTGKFKADMAVTMPKRAAAMAIWKVRGADEKEKEYSYSLRTLSNCKFSVELFNKIYDMLTNSYVKESTSNESKLSFVKEANYGINPQKEITMKAFENRTFIYGVDASTMTEDQLVAALQKAQVEAQHAENLAESMFAARSEVLDRRAAEARSDLECIINYLDNVHGEQYDV